MYSDMYIMVRLIVTLTFQSVDEILWSCYHWNETYMAELFCDSLGLTSFLRILQLFKIIFWVFVCESFGGHYSGLFRTRFNTPTLVLSPLSTKSDQHEIFPYHINALENSLVVRIERMIREDESNWYSKKFSPLLLLKKYRDGKWES